MRKSLPYHLVVLLSLLVLTYSSNINIKDLKVKAKTSSRNKFLNSTNSDSTGTRNSRKVSEKTYKKRLRSDKKISSEAGALILNVASGVMGATKKTFKSGYDILSYKHVALREIVGKWKFSQEVTLKKNVVYSCPATILFLKNGTVITTCNGKEYRTKFRYEERMWPRYCTIKFNAYAFQGPSDPEPLNLYYKGHFKRSYFNKKAILIRGKMYRTSKGLWKTTEKCGKFKASLRTM